MATVRLREWPRVMRKARAEICLCPCRGGRAALPLLLRGGKARYEHEGT